MANPNLRRYRGTTSEKRDLKNVGFIYKNEWKRVILSGISLILYKKL